MESSSLVIAIDAMGGDHAPDSVIAGVKSAEKQHSGVRFLIFGDETKVQPFIDKYKLNPERYQFVHTPDYVASDEKPSTAVRSGRNSSLWLAIDSVKKGQAAAVVSSGNTGALMAFSKLILGTMPGIHRPAIVTILPTRKSECVVLDLGANAECTARNLVEFAIMGEAYCRAVLKREHPTSGLLNIGSEEIKGRDEIRQAAQILKNSPLSETFKGFVESDDIALGTVDIFVTDGFTGNIALKAIEGTARLLVGLLKQCAARSILSKLGFLLALPSLRELKRRMDPGRYNGAMLVGLKGISIKSHGGADAFGFANAINVAVDTVKHDLVGSIAKQLETVEFLEEEKEK
ncbi:MAG: phosphate acyltransferase PlsX [Alphaproteobacteria bacterium]|nr:phosphate acyltransferase PlsX [Alphaproteobacteria bacterium]